jgi:hypothetical protein
MTGNAPHHPEKLLTHLKKRLFPTCPQKNPSHQTRQPLCLGVFQQPVKGGVIEQRDKDGYINATAMCKAAGKRFNDYTEIGPTKGFFAALSAKTGLPVVKDNQALVKNANSRR